MTNYRGIKLCKAICRPMTTNFAIAQSNGSALVEVPLYKLLILQKRALRFMCFADRCDHAIPLLLRAQTLPIHFLYYKLLAETMHDVSNDCYPFTVKTFVHPYSKNSFI